MASVFALRALAELLFHKLAWSGAYHALVLMMAIGGGGKAVRPSRPPAPFPATAARSSCSPAVTVGRVLSGRVRMYLALAAAEFRRYATYRQALIAATFTNSVFGFLRCFVLLAALAGAGASGTTEIGSLRDISVLEPDIEDVVARLYGAADRATP